MRLRPVLTNSLVAGMATALLLSGSPARAGDPDADAISGQITSYLTGRAFSKVENNVSKKSVRIPPIIGEKVEVCKGQEKKVDGAIEVPIVQGKMEGVVYVGTIEFDYRAQYRNKNFSGVFCEYQTEKKSPRGRLRIGIRALIGATSVTEFTVVSSDPSTAHDSTRMSTSAISEIVTKMNSFGAP
jgi:hypothetical protein